MLTHASGGNVEADFVAWPREYEGDPDYIANGFALELAEEASRLIEQKGLNQTRLAGIMGVSRSHVSSILNAPPNMTLLTIARLGIALGVRPMVALDSSRYYIRPLSANIDFEEFQTDRTVFLDAQATINPTPRGAVTNAVA